uniref:Uncharacterized protein n=1 Tax=Lepeophtheirus salmonis TaxID=72036 RepID=A0A0K2VBU9_LEPSM
MMQVQQYGGGSEGGGGETDPTDVDADPGRCWRLGSSLLAQVSHESVDSSCMDVQRQPVSMGMIHDPIIRDHDRPLVMRF